MPTAYSESGSHPKPGYLKGEHTRETEHGGEPCGVDPTRDALGHRAGAGTLGSTQAVKGYPRPVYRHENLRYIVSTA